MKKRQGCLKIIGGIFIFIALLSIWGSCDAKKDAARDAELTKQGEKILKDYVEVPDIYRYSTREEAEALLTSAGFKVQWVIADLDIEAKRDGEYLKENMVDNIDKEQPAITHFDDDEVGQKLSGYYAKKGSTIIMSYSDHDFDGTKLDEEASSESSEVTTETSEEPEVSSEASSEEITVNSSPQETPTDTEIQQSNTEPEYVDANGNGLIKGSNSGIYHIPGSKYYNRTTNPAAWFKTVSEAEAAGYRPPNN